MADPRAAGGPLQAGKLQLSPEEIRNGWTPEALEAELKRSAKGRQQRLDYHARPAARPPAANSRYNPKRPF